MITLNALRGVTARVHMPKNGAWIADVDVDLDTVPVVPTGKAVLTIGLNVLTGTIDDRASGRFGAKAKVRLVGGGGGWDQPLPPLHLQNDAGVFSTAVYAVTAASVGEVVVENTPPKLFGFDYARMKGAASEVFTGVFAAPWWVDIFGVTHVGPRLPLPAPPDADILTWDATNQVAEIASDTLIVPGMTLADPLRFGVAVVDDVEHVFEEGSARAIAWCSTPSLAGAATALLAAPPATAGNKLVKGLAALARQATGVDKLRAYPYRVVVQGVDGRVSLQSIDLTAQCPIFLRSVDLWFGVPGTSAKLSPASLVMVAFLGEQPVVVGFGPKSPPPLSVSFQAVKVNAGLGAHPVGLADAIVAAFGIVAANAGLTSATMTTALAPVLPLITSTNLFADGL